MVSPVLLAVITDDFYKNALFAAAVELPVKDLFPWTKIQLAFGDSDDDFPAHDLTLQVGIGIIFAGAIVSIGCRRRMRRQLFQPHFIIMMETGFIIIDE